MSDRRPLVNVLITSRRVVEFEPLAGTSRPRPEIICAPDLGTAQRDNRRIKTNRPEATTMLSIDSSAGADRTEAIVFRHDAFRIAGLIGDVVIAEVADGVIVYTDDSVAERLRLSSQLETHLTAAGFEVRSSVPGWTPVQGDAHLATS